MSTQDPDPYARLFRDDPPAPVVDDGVIQEVVVQEIVEIEQPDEPVRAADDESGRLFRSAGAAALPEAIPALTSSQASRLRTVRDRDQDAMRVEAIRPDPIPVAVVAEPTREYAPREPDVETGREGRITAVGVYVGVIGLTTLIAFGEVLIFGDQPNWITGVALVAVSVAAALGVRRRDDFTAVFAPPLAFLVVALTAGQLNNVGTTMTSRAVAAFFVLGYNWMWIVGATLAALVIVVLRRRRTG
ncbi:MAG: DUF6542 domain-containing protein [Actinomycetota bacterium]